MPYSATSIFPHTFLWTAIPSYTLCLFRTLKLQRKNSGYFEPTWYHKSLRWKSSCFPQDLQSWEQRKQVCSQYRWGSAGARTKVEDLKTVRIRSLWHTSGEWNFLFGCLVNLLNCIFIVQYIQIFESGYPHMQFYGGDLISCSREQLVMECCFKTESNHKKDRKYAYKIKCGVLSPSCCC